MRTNIPTSILIKTRNTVTSILTPMIMNTSISTTTNTTTRVLQMFTIMSIRANMVLTIITTLDTRQQFMNISIKRLNQDLGGSILQSIKEVIS
jgi:hypothetical protein